MIKKPKKLQDITVPQLISQKQPSNPSQTNQVIIIL
jgi:hypothetical protein